ncbi:MAG: hypothetical protein V4478_00295 [Patescibacteria group bacterium]
MKAELKSQAITLRKKGYSYNEITKNISVPKSTLSNWLKGIQLSKVAQKKIEAKMSNGQIAAKKAKKLQTMAKEEMAKLAALETLKDVRWSMQYTKIICAMMYYCEGAKNVQSGIRFSNSDPLVIALFMKLFRRSFYIQEEKLRVCAHLHSYHDKNEQLSFWSKTSSIPLRQFTKPFLKPSSGLHKKEGYQGCITIKYGDVTIAREMKALAIQFMEMGL